MWSCGRMLKSPPGCVTEVSHPRCFNKTPTAMSKRFKSQKCFFFSLGLIEYFSQHLGEYENVLAALEDLNLSILKAMDKTKKVSPASSILWSCFGENMKMLFLAGSFASALVTQAGFTGAGPKLQTWCSTILRLRVEAAANESPIKWIKSQLEEMSGAL